MITPYFNINDMKANEAVEFYKKAFNGEIKQLTKVKDAPGNAPFKVTSENENAVLHAMIQFWGDNIFFLSDGHHNLTIGDNIRMTIVNKNKEELSQAYNILKEDAEIEQEPEETFFAEYFTVLKDKYGIRWQLTLPKQQ